MPHLLYIESSPRKQRSASIEVARAFIDAWQTAHPDGTVDVLDVWSEPMPEFDGPVLDAKYAGIAGTPLSEEQAAAWAQIRALAARFQQADRLLISAPMWNYSIPYKLKQLIDVVSQKDLLFTFDERGQLGTLGHCKAMLVLARGVEVGDAADALKASDWDLQRQYLDLWLRMVGVTDTRHILVEKTLYGPEVDTDARAAAVAQAAALATTF
ncbi:FMN-dependent NADH-azoreductase [Methyloversatilis sp.]|uniref:FMN-dependent NADH-azoreductase n=1 Tax=Methyloversatilis sp. TaxID=2569862 RepID=UPI003F6FC83C